jgi:TIR domain
VVWNPAYNAGLQLANDVYDWFGGPNRAWHRNGLGIPVMFWTSQDAERPPPPIPIDRQDFTVVVPLVDEHFAAKRTWRDWIVTHVPKECHIRFWAVHPAAFQIDRLSPINPLGTRDCTGAVLKRLLTESCSLLLVAQRRSRPIGPLTFFISYARKDGSSIAADVRHALLNYGNVQVFMDVHDIEPGRGWQERLVNGLEDGAAMLAVVTDEYSERAWCRRELREFRTPVHDMIDKRVWWIRPVFVLDALSGNRTRSMFEIGSAPTTRWQKDAATATIDSLVRDVLFGEG